MMKCILMSFALLAVSACALPQAAAPASADATSDASAQAEKHRDPIPRDHGLFPTP